MHRKILGDFELTAVSDGIYHLDGGGMFVSFLNLFGNAA
jgi:hypothetical protein